MQGTPPFLLEQAHRHSAILAFLRAAGQKFTRRLHERMHCMMILPSLTSSMGCSGQFGHGSDAGFGHGFSFI